MKSCKMNAKRMQRARYHCTHCFTGGAGISACMMSIEELGEVMVH